MKAKTLVVKFKKTNNDEREDGITTYLQYLIKKSNAYDDSIILKNRSEHMAKLSIILDDECLKPRQIDTLCIMLRQYAEECCSYPNNLIKDLYISDVDGSNKDYFIEDGKSMLCLEAHPAVCKLKFKADNQNSNILGFCVSLGRNIGILGLKAFDFETKHYQFTEVWDVSVTIAGNIEKIHTLLSKDEWIKEKLKNGEIYSADISIEDA